MQKKIPRCDARASTQLANNLYAVHARALASGLGEALRLVAADAAWRIALGLPLDEETIHQLSRIRGEIARPPMMTAMAVSGACS